jgi:hypothetical protein
MLNMEAKHKGLSWLNFVACPQIEVLPRIAFKQALIGAGKLNISLTTNYLLQELAIAAWDTKAPKPKLLRDIPDHAMDAFDYAMEPWYPHFMTRINPTGSVNNLFH